MSKNKKHLPSLIIPLAFVLILFAGISDAVYPATTFTEVQKVTASDGGSGDRFGWSSAISGNTVIVGAYADDDNGSSSGSAYIFVNNAGSWIQQAKLTASDGAANDQFGWSVAIFGDTAIVGARRDDSFGSAYVFVRNAGVWSEQQKLTGSGATFTANFGQSVAIENDTAIVGAYNDNDGGVTTAGSAYVFERNAGVWSQKQKLTASDSATNDRFGWSVAISNGTAIIGSYLDDDNGDSSGSVYIFAENSGVWSQQQKVTASDGAMGDVFGQSVAISGDTAIVGARNDDGQTGSAYAFVRNSGVWSEQQKLVANDQSSVDWFGFSVAVSGDVAIIGAPRNDTGSSFDNGSAYVFARSSGVWTEQQNLEASDGAAGDRLGQSVAISPDHAVAGAYVDDSNGSAYIFNPVQTTFTVTKTADTNDGICDADCSLREAIAATNAVATDDTIDFASPLFDTPQTITLGGTVLTINNNGKTTIDGTGADLLTISGNNASRVLHVSNGAEVEINAVTISDGRVVTSGQLGGGGILNDGGTVTINNSTIRDNVNVNGGAGIWNGDAFFNLYVGTIIINNSTISNNVSDTPFGGGSGGGLRNQLGTATLNNSTLSGNSGVNGGGIFNDGGATLNLNNSTIVNNSPTGNIGGVWNYGGSLVIANTIVANNTNGDCAGSNGTNYSLIEDGSCFGGSGNLSGDPNLGPLQDNGGSTFTHELLAGSSAIDAGSNALIPAGVTTDQRGAGFPRIANSTVDIGAFEVTTPAMLDQTITFSALADKTYGDASFNISATASSGLPVSFTASGNCTVVGSTVTITGAGSCTITASQAGDATYNPAPDVDQSFDIAKALLNVTPDDQMKTFSDSDPPFTFSYSGFVYGETSAVIDTEPVCNVSGAHTDAGTYTITCSGGADDNYDFNYGTATLTVNKADQTITFDALADKTYGDAPFNLSATASSGLSVSYSAAGVCTVVGNTVTLTGAGNCTITASQSGNNNYEAAPDVDQSFTVNKAVLTVTPDDQAIIVGSPDPAFTFSYSGFVNGENAGVIDTAPTCQVSGAHTAPGSYTITCSGGVDNNYDFSYETATLNVFYNFNGFFSPIDNFGLNLVKAGRAVPIKFSLNGNFGLNIMASGYPASVQIPCSNETVDDTEIPTLTAGNSSLSYSAGSDKYTYVWKTLKEWKNTCRRLIVVLDDGSAHTADFKYK